MTTEVVCLGESMVTFLPSRPGPLADVPSFSRAIGGAESNVACALAAAGHRTAWVSRVGADGFGDHLLSAIAAYGVDVSRVRRDPARPTGVYFRTAADRAGGAHEVAYYRAGSAASAMSPSTVPLADTDDGRVLHVSGITAALSAGCLDLLRALTARREGRPLVSFDVNHRPGLWRGHPEGPGLLLDLARGADLVLVGEDEAAEAWGLHGPEAVRRALPEPRTLVVKRGAAGAVLFSRDPELRAAEGTAGTAEDLVVSVPAPHVDVVAAVGAGDAFAAGFLSGTLRGLPAARRLRLGHLMAAAVLGVASDVCPPPARDVMDRLVALDDPAWEALHLPAGGPDGPAAPRRATASGSVPASGRPGEGAA